MSTGRVIRVGFVLLIVTAAAGSSGCSTMNNTEKGVGLGAATGAGVGLGIGALTHHPELGAVAGGLVGAGVGGAVGNNIDRKEDQRRDAVQVAAANAQAQPKMGMMDVVQMVQAGHAPQVIINQIHATGSTFQLSQTDLDYLKTYNVPPEVIVAMQTARPPVYVPSRPVVYQTAPAVVYESPPPVYVYGGPRPVYVGGVYYGCYRRW